MFKYITQAEFDKLKFRPRAGHIKSRERLTLEALAVGKIIVISDKEWTLKNGPSGMLTAITQQMGRKFKSRALLGGGWAVMRIK